MIAATLLMFFVALYALVQATNPEPDYCGLCVGTKVYLKDHTQLPLEIHKNVKKDEKWISNFEVTAIDFNNRTVRFAHWKEDYIFQVPFHSIGLVIDEQPWIVIRPSAFE